MANTKNRVGADVPPPMINLPHDEMGEDPNLSAVEMLALAKGGTRELTDDINDSVGAGSYAVDFTVRVMGGLRKGEPQEQMVVMEIPVWAIIYQLSQEVSPLALQRSIDRAYGADEGKVKNFKSECEKLVSELKGKTKRVIRGKVTTALTFTKV